MPRHNRYPAYQPLDPSVISRRNHGDLPEMGDIINGQRRALLGWSHKKDNAKGLRTGKIWCWVSRDANPKLQVYDTAGNRAPFAGPRIDCGMANFSMVRMFHPYWCPGGHIPQDMNLEDKKNLRSLYHELIAESLQRYENDLNSAGEDDDDSDADDNDDARRDREELRQLHAAEQSGIRGTQAWNRQMGRRYHRRQFNEWIGERNAASGQHRRRQRQRTTAARTTATARRSAARTSGRRDSSASTSVSRGPTTRRERRRRLGSETYDRIQGMFDDRPKTNTPGSALHDNAHAGNFLGSSDDENMVDIQHDDHNDQTQREMLDIFSQIAAQEVAMDLPDDLNNGSSNRATRSQEIINIEDDPNNHSMFFSDIASSLEEGSRRKLSDGSSSLSGGRSSAGAGPSRIDGDARTSRTGSTASQRSVKSEKIKTEPSSTLINLDDYGYDDDEVMITSSRSMEDAIGSEKNPVALD